MIDVLHAVLLNICLGSSILDHKTVTKKREEDDRRLKTLSKADRYEEAHKRYLRNLSR